MFLFSFLFLGLFWRQPIPPWHLCSNIFTPQKMCFVFLSFFSIKLFTIYILKNACCVSSHSARHSNNLFLLMWQKLQFSQFVAHFCSSFLPDGHPSQNKLNCDPSTPSHIKKLHHHSGVTKTRVKILQA